MRLISPHPRIIQRICMSITASQLKQMSNTGNTHIDNTLPTVTISPWLSLSINEDLILIWVLTDSICLLKISLTFCYILTTWLANCSHWIKIFFDVLFNLEKFTKHIRICKLHLFKWETRRIQYINFYYQYKTNRICLVLSFIFNFICLRSHLLFWLLSSKAFHHFAKLFIFIHCI